MPQDWQMWAMTNSSKDEFKHAKAVAPYSHRPTAKSDRDHSDKKVG
jgi:hypothetical protein